MNIEIISDGTTVDGLNTVYWEITYLDTLTGEIRVEEKLFGKTYRSIEATVEVTTAFLKLRLGDKVDVSF